MKFPVPHDVKAKAIPGTEGWERMYPYQYQFVTDDPQRNQYEKETFWFYDGLHYPEPLYPFDTIWDEAWYLALSQFNNRIFMVPPVRGVDHRIINGYVYISPVPVKDPEEIGKRVPNFMERAGYYYKNWDALEAKWKVKMEATIRELEALKIPRLADMEDMSVVTDALGVAMPAIEGVVAGDAGPGSDVWRQALSAAVLAAAPVRRKRRRESR